MALKLNPVIILFIGIITVVLLGIADYITGPEISFSVFYLIPVSFVAWFAGLTFAIIVAAFSAAMWHMADTLLTADANPLSPAINALIRLGLLILAGFVLAKLKKSYHNFEDAVRNKTIACEMLIGEKGQFEKALTSSEKKYRSLVDNALVGVYQASLDGDILFANDALTSMLEFGSFEELKKEKMQTIYKDIRDRTSLLEILNRYRQTNNFETQLLTKYGETKNILLSARLDGSIISGMIMDITNHKKAEKKIEYLAYYDILSSLPNRRLLTERLMQAIKYSEHSNEMFALLLIDLTNLKRINDAFGRGFGDLLLKKVGSRLVKCVRETDTVARIGGNEFAILTTNIKLLQNVARLAQNIFDCLSRPIFIQNRETHISSNIGISIYPVDGKDSDSLISNAYIALNNSKLMGENTYQFFTQQMQIKTKERLILDNQLRHAIERNELKLYYQPIFNLKTGQIEEAEALLRWQHPDRGLTAPEVFLTVAEESGFINTLSEWVMQKVVQQIKVIKESDLALSRIYFNLSGHEFPTLISTLNFLFDEFIIDGQSIGIEITENVLMKEKGDVIAVLEKLRKKGIKISIDDFGTGYSSLGYLRYMPIDEIKISRLFISEIVEKPEILAIVKSIIFLSHSLGLKVVAEGVEKKEQIRLLEQEGCDKAQGFYLGKPAPANKFIEILKRKKPFGRAA